jgi:hypothetical protein
LGQGKLIDKYGDIRAAVAEPDGEVDVCAVDFVKNARVLAGHSLARDWL